MLQPCNNLQATRIAYSNNNKDFRRVVTLDGALFEKSGTMSGGGSKPRGGKMSSSIRSSGVSGEAVTDAEKELSKLVESLNSLRQKINDAVKCYQAAEKAISLFQMELAKGEKEVRIIAKQYIAVTSKSCYWIIFVENGGFLTGRKLKISTTLSGKATRNTQGSI